MFKNLFKNIGPGTLVAAAFVGPGTVTVCTLAGVNFGYELLWAMLLSIGATVVLQEMAARLGVVSQKGLSELIRSEIKHPLFKTLMVFLILAAIVVGNASYEAGNIAGGILGLETLVGQWTLPVFGQEFNGLSLVVGAVAFGLLYIGNYKFLERLFIGLVLLMSLSFVFTALLTKPNLIPLLKGLFVPSLKEGNLLTVIGLVGTTVVPYNLFLHASLVKEKWKHAGDLRTVRKDTLLSIILGGLVSMAIIVSAAALPKAEISNAADLAKSLVPLFGNSAQYLMGIGLFAAGITSAITAPLAAAFVVKGCFGWSSDLKRTRFRLVWMLVLGTGIVLSSMGFKPIQVIQFAQVANGVLLPVIAGVLLWVVNRRSVLGSYANSRLQNVMGFLIVLLAIFLGCKGIFKVFDWL